MQYIADQLGISKVTVSKALNDKDGVSDELKQKIKETAGELGYKVPGVEEPLASPKNIAIIVQEKYVEINDYVTFYLKFYQKLASTLNRRGYMCNLFTLSNEQNDERMLPAIFSRNHISGVVVMGHVKLQLIAAIKELGIPVVFLDCYNAGANVDSILTDNYYSTYEITNYLVGCGHGDIGFVGSIGATSSIQDRFLGYCRSLMEADKPIRQDWIVPDRDENSEEIAFVLPEQMPTAFVCNCDDTAYKFVNHLKTQGYRVPEDISIVAFDNDIHADLCRPRLTTVAVDIDTMTEKATSRIIDRIEKDELSKQRKIFVTGDIVYRDSVKKIN